MGKRLASLLAVMWMASASWAFTDGFETGTLNPAWIKVYDAYPAIVTSADNGQIRPRSGSYMASTPRTVTSWPCVRRSVGTPSGGTVTAYVNSSGFSDNYLFSIAVLGPSGSAVRLMNGGSGGTVVRVNTPSGDNLTGITIASRTWHEVKFIVSPLTGTNVYWNGILVRSNEPNVMAASKIEFGTQWGCALAAYDDISFVPTIADGNVTTVTGTVALDDYPGDPRDVCVRIELIQNGALVRTVRTPLDAAGKFRLAVVPSDLYDIGLKSHGHLRTVLTNRAITGPVIDLGTINLTAGDGDGDNEVTTSDLATILLNMDLMGDL